ncbi:hypothetical protein [Corynebacterium bovis]|nr:hypothetical protein [Corynebacterium bovis]
MATPMSVDFPPPFGPMSAVKPEPMSSETLSRAVVVLPSRW